MKRGENFGVVTLGRLDPPTYINSENEMAGCQMAESDFSQGFGVDLDGKYVNSHGLWCKNRLKFFGQNGGGRAYFNIV